MILVDAQAYVPFEPRTPEQYALRAELRSKLKALKVARTDEILWATFSGRLPNGADVENALLYNLDDGRAFAGSIDNGVSFELDPKPPETGVRYRYEIAPIERGFRCWRAEREFAAVVAELDEKPTLASIWWALRSGSGSIRSGGEMRRSHERFAAMLEVEGPVHCLKPVLVKSILDGVVCGLQSQADDAGAALMAPRIAQALGVSTGSVEHALTHAGPSVLGVRARLVHARGGGVQWAPDDDRCVAARLLFRPADHWRITGTVAVVAPRSMS